MKEARKDPWNKTREHWKEMKKWWREFLGWAKDACVSAVMGMLYEILWAREEWAEWIANFRSKKEWITRKEAREQERKAQKHAEKAEEYKTKKRERVTKSNKGTRRAWKWWLKVLEHAAGSVHNLVDTWDKWIWERIEERETKHWKKLSWEMLEIAKKNIMKILWVLWLVWILSFEWWKHVGSENGHQEESEVVIQVEDDEDSDEKVGKEVDVAQISTESVEIPGWSPDFEERAYFQNPDFFDKEFKLTRDETYKDKWVILLRDAWMNFYVVQEWEKSKEKIREKLAAIPEFSYLSDSTYDDKIMGFNVPSKSLKKDLFIPIPVKAEDRKINIDEFRAYSKISVQEMKSDPVYWERMKKLLDEIGEERVINIMTAYARCETATDHEKFSDPIWTTVLHRWEPGTQKTPINAFSFSYYHILMEKNADKITPWPWLKARLNLWLTEWQCYHPINAWKLFLWYCFEKRSDPTYFFRIKNLSEAKVKWKTYNGSASYWEKLWGNIQHISKK